MNKRIIVVLSMIFTALLIASAPFPIIIMNTQAADRSTQTHQIVETNAFGINQLPPFAPGVVLVGLKQGVVAGMGVRGAETTDSSLNSALTRFGIRDIEPVFPLAPRSPLTVNAARTRADLSRTYRLRFSPDANVLQIVQELNAHPAVEYAEPDYLAHIVTTPNDPEYPNQWGLAKINAPAAWDVVTGATDVVIAIVDAGVDVTHPDLNGQLWENPGEIPGNGIDDDNNGYVDDIHGWNLVDNNADLSDNTGHGTEVAGVAAAATNNSTGIAGMCWQCRLMVVKVVQLGGVANYSDIAAGVAYAAQKGAKVINISLGGNSDSITLKTAISNAAQTAVIVAGAGNDNSSAPFYPAAYDDYVLAVAGTTQTDTKVSTSNYGTWMDVSAPGENIRTTFTGGGYGDASGTSVAAPFVSGLAGLLRSQNPTWSANQTRAQIINTTDNIDSLNPGYEGKLGSGRINAQTAITMLAEPVLVYLNHAIDGEPNGKPEPGSIVDLDLTILNDWADAANVQATLSTTDNYVIINAGTASYGNIKALESGMNLAPFRFSLSGSTPYAHDITFTSNVTADGGYAVSIPFTVTTSAGIVYVHGTLTTQVWTNDHTYVVNNNAGIEANHILTIEPGTVVYFDGDYSLNIAGTLIAEGTEEQPIRFTSNQASPGEWHSSGIVFLDSSVDATFDGEGNYTGGSILRHTFIENVQGVRLDNSAPFIAHNVFEPLGMGPELGITGFAESGLVVSDNTIIGGSIWLDGNSTNISILRNTISRGNIDIHTQNQVTIVGNSVSKGIHCIHSISESSSSVVSANRVVDCGGVGMWVHGGLISNNLLANNKLAGLCTYGTPTVEYNTIVFNEGDPNTVSAGVDVVSGNSILHHDNLIANEGKFALNNSTQAGIDATGNWWGTTDESAIQATIYDGNDEFGKGIVDYSEYLLEPEQEAPAYLNAITLIPASPVGIQAVTFNLAFSRPMDQGYNPIVAFGLTEPYTTYQVANSAEWLDSYHWRATYDITSLVPRGTYTISVSGAKGTDGMEIPTDTRFSFVVDYAGQITDQTPPNVPLIIAGGKEGDPSTIEAMWWASDPDSDITGYRYAIGTAPGATDIVNWTTTSDNFFTKTGLGLVEGRQYWVAVQALNIGGLWSTGGYSAFVSGQPMRKIFLPLVFRGR